MLVNDDSGVLRDITGDFLGSLLIDETTESSDINVLSFNHRILNHFEERFYSLGYVVLLDACFV